MGRFNSLKCPSTVSRRTIWLSVVALALPALAAAQALPPEVVAYADTIFTNGKVLTVDKDFIIAEAIAVRDGKVLATGTTGAIERMAGPKTKRIDLAGKSVIPGIIDTHLHTWYGAINARKKDIAA